MTNMHAEGNPEMKAIDALPESSCPLCGRIVPHNDLYPHFKRDWPVSYRGTIQVIKAYHPDWVEDQGVCLRCWRSYAEATRVIYSLRSRNSRERPAPRLSLE